MPESTQKDLAYYLTLFRLEGHETWRAHLSGSKDGFAIEQKNWGKHPAKITEVQTLRIDRVSGMFQTRK